MCRHSIIVALLAVLLLSWACGGAKSRGTSTAPTGAAKPRTTFDFGRSTTWQSLHNVVTDLLERNNYHRTRVGTPNLIETDWRTMAPDSIEANQGIFETRHKVIVSITTRRDISVATLRLTCEARFDNGPWLKSNPNSEVLRIVQEMQRQAKLELSQYIQQW
ncbi:hypothetical protein L0337_18700 [candidate division KSB1 bacterium]|nr:hypothetical protein [candidate division KSB1 bacterium]